MANIHSFAAAYSEARDKFLAAARVAGATTWRYDNPSKGPKGEALSTDVARLGSDDASKVVVTSLNLEDKIRKGRLERRAASTEEES